jgi:hypothetical protein
LFEFVFEEDLYTLTAPVLSDSLSVKGCNIDLN